MGIGAPKNSSEHVTTQKASVQTLRARHAVLFRFLLVLLVLSPLVLTELVLRVCVPAPMPRVADAYISFGGPDLLFVLDANGTRFETSPNRLDAFRPQSFAAVKAAGGFRVFCLGGSTVQGRPYSVETSFTAWLELNLRAAKPDTEIEVVNCGGISYASYRLVGLMTELLEYEPDLFIICTGHNEFLEDRTYARLKKTPAPLIRLHRTLLHLRSYALADRFLSRRSKSWADAPLTERVQTKLDSPEALDAYHRDDAWRQRAVEDFGRNLEAMARMAQGAGVPVILVDPVANLKDCPPFKSQSADGLSEDRVNQVAELRRRAGSIDWGDSSDKITLLEQAVAIDHRDAGLLFLLGKCYERLGRFDEARKWFAQAKDEDVCPLRILEPMHTVIREVASRYDLPLVDVVSLIEQRTPGGIPGKECLLDHVHPSIASHRAMADALFGTMEEMGLTQRPEGWSDARNDLWRRHLSSLNPAYYAHGLARLKRLTQWSRGRIPAE